MIFDFFIFPYQQGEKFFTSLHHNCQQADIRSAITLIIWLSGSQIECRMLSVRLQRARGQGSVKSHARKQRLTTAEETAKSAQERTSLRCVIHKGQPEGFGKPQSINLRGCSKVTDTGISALDAGYGQLQNIYLGCCFELTDAGISALAAGCGQLQRIDLESCYQVTDAGVSALGAGCGQLQSINCGKVTDTGVIALGAGCGQLRSISLASCDKVTDAGVSALGAGCGRLRILNLEGCYQVTDAVVSALGLISFVDGNG